MKRGGADGAVTSFVVEGGAEAVPADIAAVQAGGAGVGVFTIVRIIVARHKSEGRRFLSFVFPFVINNLRAAYCLILVGDGVPVGEVKYR